MQLSSREPVTKTIVRDLREAILNGHLEPGHRLPQESLATRYQASRVPVQQALRELEDEGLVTLAPKCGCPGGTHRPQQVSGRLSSPRGHRAHGVSKKASPVSPRKLSTGIEALGGGDGGLRST